MTARLPDHSGSARAAGGGATWFDDGAPSETAERDGEPADLWSLPHDVPTAPAATDTLLAAWAGVLTQGGDTEASPDREHTPTGPAAGRHRAPDDPPRQVDATRPGLMTTVLVSVIASAVVGLAALLVLGVFRADIRISVGGSTGSTATDNRVVTRGPSEGCPTMLVEPRRAGTATNVNGTCFLVG
jgi:hypothetical protein